jgi:hypothetical protein
MRLIIHGETKQSGMMIACKMPSKTDQFLGYRWDPTRRFGGFGEAARLGRNQPLLPQLHTVE